MIEAAKQKIIIQLVEQIIFYRIYSFRHKPFSPICFERKEYEDFGSAREGVPPAESSPRDPVQKVHPGAALVKRRKADWAKDGQRTLRAFEGRIF